jgi:hypothetical protein
MFGMDLFFKSAAAGMKIARIGMETMFKMMELFAGLSCQKEKPAKTDAPIRKKTTDIPQPPPVKKVQAQVKVSEKTVPAPNDKKKMPSKGISPSASETAPDPASRQKTIPLKSDMKTEKKAVSPKKSSPSEKKPSTAIDKVHAFMASQKQGASAEDIMKATGFNKKKVQDILYKLKKRGILKSDKGIYIHV